MKIKIILPFVFLSISLVFSQEKKEKYNYKKAMKQEKANFYDIVNKKQKEINYYDKSLLKNKKAKKHFFRWATFWKDRINEDGTFPSELQGYYNAGILESNGKVAVKEVLTSAKSSSGSWVNVGPQDIPDANGYPNYPQMGRLNCFLRIAHPTDTNLDVLFVGAPNGGVWKSTDGGTTWEAKLDAVAGIGVTDIKTTPTATYSNYATEPIYISTGDYDGLNVSSIGVLKSTDGGETFQSTGLGYSIDQKLILGDLIVYDEDTVLVGTSSGIEKTVDGGLTWSTAFDAGYEEFNGGRVAIDGLKAMYTGEYDVVYTNNFLTGSWSAVLEGLEQNKRAVTLGEDGSFYIQELEGQIKKFNGSTAFTNVGSVPTDYDSQGGFNQTLIVKNDIMLSGSVDGMSSTNSGSSWYKALNGYWVDSSSDGVYVHSDHHRMGELSGTYEYWSVNDGGLSYFDFGTSAANQSPSITYKSSKVYVTQHYSVAINPSVDDGAYVTGNQDNDAFSKKNGVWYAVALGDGVQSAINYNNSNIRYASDQSGLIIQTNTGFEGELSGNGNSVTVAGVNFDFPLEMNKVDPNILYAGGDDLYKISAASGLTIADMNAGVGAVKDVATHGTNILVAGENGLTFSSNGGTTWSSVSGSVTGSINSVDFDATNSNTMYVTVSSYSAGNKIFKSTNGGTSFTNISGDLPNIVIKEVLLKQGQSEEYLFLATELGVYYSVNAGVNWSKLGNGLPNVDVRDIEIHYTADKLVAATFGRGLWEVDITNNTLSNSNVTEGDEVGLVLYPNPSSIGTLNVSLNTNDSYEFIIYNVVGGIVKRGEIVGNSTINILDLADNLYVIRLYNTKIDITRKFIKGGQ